MSDSPSPQPTNAHLEELMSGYVLNALSPEETAEFEQYLRTRPELAQQMHQLEEVMGWMAHASKTQAPPQLRSKILAIPQAARTQSTKVVSFPQWKWQKIGTAIAALLLLGLGIDNLLLRQRLTTLEAEVAEEHQDYFTFELKGTKSAAMASAKVMVDAHAGEVMVGVQNLPPLPQGEAYYLWAFTTDRTQILCGRFNTDQAGQFVERISVDPSIYTNPIAFMRISRESTASPTKGLRKLVLTSES